MLCKHGHEKEEGQKCNTCSRAYAARKRAKIPKYVDCEICSAQNLLGAVCRNEANHAELIKWRKKADHLRKTSPTWVLDQNFWKHTNRQKVKDDTFTNDK